MKHKFSSMGRVAIALVLALSLSLVMAVPLSAVVSEPVVTVEPNTISTVAKYTIDFNTGTEGDLSMNVGTITVTFDTTGSGTTVPTGPTPFATGDITVNGSNVLVDGASVAGQIVTITTPVAISASSPVQVIFTIDADIVNPATEGTTYTLSVATSGSGDTGAVDSAAYTIIGPPAVDKLEPARGNPGDTMWVEVTGSNFIGDADTDVSDTTLNFGSDITVVSKYVAEGEIDCQITISATATAGAVNVEATTTAGTGTTTEPFTINATTALQQVDVWNAYDPTATDFDTNTLIPDTPTMTYNTVKEAVADCDGTETVLVHPATYSPTAQILVSQAVTIQSLTGLKTGVNSAADTIIDCTDVNISTGAIHIGIDGVVIQGLTIMDTTTTFASKGMGLIASNHNDVTVKNCVITGAEWIAIGLGGTLEATTIQDNTISNSLGWAIVAIDAFDVSAAGALDIKGNTITGCGSGLLQAYPDDLYEVIGIRPGGEQDLSGVSIENNVIADNSVPGLFVDNFSAGNSPVIRYNDIHNNGTWGLYCPDTDGVDARYNYWGSMGGPSAGTGGEASGALGNGDAVSRYVTYNPWLSVSYETVVDEGKRYYGSDALTLQAGWNTLSVPLELYDLANSIAEIEAMGDFLTAANYADYIVEYEPGEGWLTPTTLAPCRGYYIKMKAASNFPVLYCNSLGLPALELTAGWNLIGSAFGIDKLESTAGKVETWAVGYENGTHTEAGDNATVMTDENATFIADTLIGLTIENVTDGSSGVITDNDATTVTVASLTGGNDNDWDTGDIYLIADTEAVMDISDALDSIRDQVSAVISPSVPGQIGAPWSVIWAAGGTGNFMYTGEGYWVFMTDTGTLAGWEITPFYFAP